jgi:hypothetical protein
VTGGRRRFLVAAVFLTLPAACLVSGGGTLSEFGSKIAKRIGGWEASGKDRTFNRQTLYDYMDGGAEVYLAFDLREVWARKYKGPRGAEMTLDIYDMGSPGEAFGAFSCDRQDPEAGVGQESEYGPGLLRFWQGRYFVTITCSAEDQDAAGAVVALGKEAVKWLGPPGQKPDLVGFLPEESLRRDRTSFFHSVINLNNRFFIASENILGLDQSTDCVIAEYDLDSAEPATLLLVRYPSPEKAASARRSFLAAYLPEAGPEGLARTEGKNWVAAAVKDRYLTVVFEAPSPDLARKLGASVTFPAK